MIPKILSLLKEEEADKDVILQESDFLLVEKKLGYTETKRVERLGSVSGTLSPEISEEKLAKIQERLASQNIDVDFQVALPTGGPFKNYGEIDNVFDENKTELSHKPGEVLLVDIWATWCPPCQKPMAHNQEMLQKNAHWKDKVRIVGVSVDESKDVIKKRVDDKKWHSVIHLTLLGWNNDHLLIKDFRIQGIPFVCLVDKFGKINYLGHPMQIDLEKRINELISQQSESAAAAAPAAEAAPHQNEEEMKKFFESLSKERVEQHFKDVSLFCFQFVMKTKFEKGKYQKKGTINASVMNDDPIAQEKANSFFDKHPDIQLTINKVNYITIPNTEGAKCWECTVPLEYPFYWLKWEEGAKFGCRKCIEAASDIEGHHYKYEKNAVLLTGKWEKLAEKNVGKNHQPPVAANTEPHGFGCNSCGQGAYGDIGKARYICQGCRMAPNLKGDYVDICETCIQKLLKGEEQALEGLKPDNHQINHPFLRVLYNTHGYYDF